MKLAAPYPLKKDRQKIIDEYNIDFIINKHKINDLVDWIRQDHLKDKRINLKIIAENKEDILPIDSLTLLTDINKNIFIRLQLNQGELVPLYKENNIKFFFDYDFNINSFCRLKDALEQGVTDVYIMEDLCYKLSQVKKLCDKYNVQIRLLANMISSFTAGRETDFTAPFYAPENMNTLELYYDVIEFELFGSWNRFDTLYRIWFKNKEWRDDLRFINFELGFSIPGESFPRELCEYKMNCGHRCVERQSVCRKCQQYIELAQSMSKKGIEYTTNQKWVENRNDEPIKDIFN